MRKQQCRALVTAVALATSFAVLPGMASAAEEQAEAAAESIAAGNTAAPGGTAEAGKTEAAAGPAGEGAAEAGAQPAAPETAEQTAAAPADQPAEQEAKETSSGDKVVDQRAREWNKNRPQEEAIEAQLAQFEDMTVVDVVFEGTSQLTETTSKAALSMHAGDPFTAKALMRDRDAIYNTGYFYDIYPSFEKVPEGVVLTYHVLENPILRSVTIKGNTVESTETLNDLLTIRTGEILNARMLHENVQALQERYSKDGYILAKLTDMNIDEEGNLTLTINEGILEGYAVKGNKKTKDKVILREMRQKTGEPFNSKLARRSVQRVYNLGFFENVEIKMNPGVAPNAVVMEVDVKEKRTGTFGIGAGYSNADGVVGMISLSDKNFRGTGDSISLIYEISGNSKDAHGFVFAYRHPWMDKRQTALSLRIYNRTYSYADYDSKGEIIERFMRRYTGGEIGFSRPISEYSTNSIRLMHRKDSYVEHDDEGTDRSTSAYKDWRNKNFGTTRSLTLGHTTDTRDNIYYPTEGNVTNLSAEFAGFGADFNFQKYRVEHQRYYKLGRKYVLAVRGEYGYGNGNLSEFNQFRIGGQSTLRGYREDQFRGNRMGILSVEFRFPIVKKVNGAIFADGGSAWDSGFFPHSGEMHGSVGFGVSVETPFGPLRLDYGKGDQGGRVHFSVGGSF